MCAILAEDRIQEAIRAGEFENLPGRGAPLDLADYFATPAELRMGYSLLKSGGFAPVEVELLRVLRTMEDKKSAAEKKSRTESNPPGSSRRYRVELETRLRIMLEAGT